MLIIDGQFSSENSHYIKSVALEYVLNDILWYATLRNDNLDKNIYREYLCLPQIHFKFNTMYLTVCMIHIISFNL